MFFHAVFYLLAGMLLIFFAFPALRGKRDRRRPTTEQKVWRVLLLISALLLLALGSRLMYVVMNATDVLDPNR
jgi:threonine/homoserine/homoserine lactone efflux protein